MIGEEAHKNGVSFNSKHEQSLIDKCINDHKQISRVFLLHSIRAAHNLQRREHKSEILRKTGGCPGNMQHLSTGLKSLQIF